MKITEVRIYPYESKKGSLVAFASVTFDRCFVVRGFRVFDGKNGLFAACPSEEIPNGEYRDTAFPVTAEFREELLDAIVEAYENYDEDDERPKKSSGKKSSGKMSSGKKSSGKKSSGKKSSRKKDEDEDEEDEIDEDDLPY